MPATDEAYGKRPGASDQYQQVPQGWSCIEGVPPRDDSELGALMGPVRRLPRGNADNLIESVLRACLGYERHGREEYLTSLASAVLLSVRARTDPAVQVALDAAPARPAAPGDSADVEELLRERGLA